MKYRVIINGVIIHGLTRRQLAECFGVDSQRRAIDWCVLEMRRSRIKGIATRVFNVDIQLDMT